MPRTGSWVIGSTTKERGAAMEELEKRVDERTHELRRLNEILQDEVRRHEQTAADLERARKAAEAANLGKTRFLAAASHDLLQPLNAARLYLSALEASPLVDPGARGLLDTIEIGRASCRERVCQYV